MAVKANSGSCFWLSDTFVRKVVQWVSEERLKVYPVVIMVMTIIVWGVVQFIGPGLTDAAGIIIGSDFLAFYNAGSFFLQNRTDELYNFQSQKIFQDSVVAPISYNMFHPFINPPFTAPFFSLFAHNSYLVGLISWWVLGFTLLFMSVYLLRTHLRGLNTFSLPRLFLMCLAFYPTLAWFMFGQNTPISLFFLTIFFISLRARKDFIGGIFLGLLLFKPQLTLGMIFLLLFKKRWWSLAGVFLGGLFWIMIGFMTSPHAMWEYMRISPYLMELLRLKIDKEIITFFGLNSQGFHYSTWGINSLYGFSVLLLDNISRLWAELLFGLLSLMTLIYLIHIWHPIRWEPGTKAWNMNFAATLVLCLLLSPHLFLYDLMILLLPLGIILNYYNGYDGKILDGYQLYFCTILLYMICFCGNYLTYFQIKACYLLNLPPFAIQFSTLVMIGWSVAVHRSASLKNEPIIGG